MNTEKLPPFDAKAFTQELDDLLKKHHLINGVCFALRRMNETGVGIESRFFTKIADKEAALHFAKNQAVEFLEKFEDKTVVKE